MGWSDFLLAHSSSQASTKRLLAFHQPPLCSVFCHNDDDRIEATSFLNPIACSRKIDRACPREAWRSFVIVSLLPTSVEIIYVWYPPKHWNRFRMWPRRRGRKACTETMLFFRLLGHKQHPKSHTRQKRPTETEVKPDGASTSHSRMACKSMKVSQTSQQIQSSRTLQRAGVPIPNFMGGSNGLKEGKEEPNKATSIQHPHSNVHLKIPSGAGAQKFAEVPVGMTWSSSPWKELFS